MSNFIAERVKKVRIAQGLSQKDFASALTVSQGVISDIENGRKGPSRNVLLKLRSQFNVNANWLLTGDGSLTTAVATGAAGALASASRSIQNVDDAMIQHGYKSNFENEMQKTPLADTILLHTGEISKDDFLVPLLDQKLSAGKGQYLPEDDTPKTFITAPKHLQKYSKNLAALYVDGDSMEPTLNRGDMIICDSLGWSGEGIYAIQMDDCGFVKRISRRPGKTVIISDNPAYESFEEPIESEAVRIIGRVRCVVRIVE